PCGAWNDNRVASKTSNMAGAILARECAAVSAQLHRTRSSRPMPSVDPGDMRPVIVSVLAGVLPLAGCLQMEQTITFGADGAGTHEVALTLPEATLAEVRRAAIANQTGTAIDPQALFARETVAKEL